jgi:hypothetical protein
MRLGATGELNPRDFNVDFSAPMQNGGVVVSDKIQPHLETEARTSGNTTTRRPPLKGAGSLCSLASRECAR